MDKINKQREAGMGEGMCGKWLVALQIPNTSENKICK
jgi:hypothetical protein